MPSLPDTPESPQYKATMERLERMKHASPTGLDYWLAREISAVLGYVRWENFQEAIKRAMSACEAMKVAPQHHFRETTKVMKGGKGASMRIADVFLSRTGCWLIAMNGDPTKPEIAAAQARGIKLCVQVERIR